MTATTNPRPCRQQTYLRHCICGVTKRRRECGVLQVACHSTLVEKGRETLAVSTGQVVTVTELDSATHRTVSECRYSHDTRPRWMASCTPQPLYLVLITVETGNERRTILAVLRRWFVSAKPRNIPGMTSSEVRGEIAVKSGFSRIVSVFPLLMSTQPLLHLPPCDSPENAARSYILTL